MSSKPYKLSCAGSPSCDLEGANDITTSSSSVIRCNANSKDLICDNKDLISELPNEILCDILLHMTLRDAVKTSILSHRWRNLSSLLPELQFHWQNMFQTGPVAHQGDGSHVTSCVGRLVCTDKFIQSVDQFLDFYDNRHCKSFTLNFCLGRAHADAVDRWVCIALRKLGLETLSLKSYCYDKCCIQREDPPVFLGHQFQHMAAVSLKSLHLSRFIIGPEFSTSGFLGSLGCLKMDRVTLAPSCDMQSVLSAMPSLTDLQMVYCVGLPVELHLGSLRLLKRIRIALCPSVKKVVLPSNMNLTRIFCVPTQFVSCDGSIGQLRGAEDIESHKYMFTYLPGDHPKLKSLGIVNTNEWITCIPEQISTFHEVTELELYIHSKESQLDLLKMITIIKAFPSLHKFVLGTWCSGDSDQSAQSVQDTGNYVHRHLKVAMIRGYLNSAAIGFSAFLLRRAANLRRLILEKLGYPSLFARVEWDENEREAICDKLQGLPTDKVGFR